VDIAHKKINAILIKIVFIVLTY